MDYKKIVTPVIITVASVGSYYLLRNKANVSHKDAIATAKDSAETIGDMAKTFAGVTQDELDDLAAKTSRGVKAIIDGDILKYLYRSASGKHKNVAEFKRGPEGELVGTLFSNFTANSPRVFGHNLNDLIKSKIET